MTIQFANKMKVGKREKNRLILIWKQRKRWNLRLYALLTDLDFFRMRNLRSRDLDLKVPQGRRRNEKATSRDIILNSGRRGAKQHTTEN